MSVLERPHLQVGGIAEAMDFVAYAT